MTRDVLLTAAAAVMPAAVGPGCAGCLARWQLASVSSIVPPEHPHPFIDAAQAQRDCLHPTSCPETRPQNPCTGSCCAAPSKQALLDALQGGGMEPFHERYHRATDYGRWTKADDYYEVSYPEVRTRKDVWDHKTDPVSVLRTSSS